MGRREPRGRASALPRRGPHLYFICPAELNSAGIKVLGPRPKTLGRRKAPPRRRRGPRRGRRIKRAPDVLPVSYKEVARQDRQTGEW